MKIALTIALVFCSFFAHARTNCPIAKVQNIQIEGNVILYHQEGYPWRRLGTLSEEGTKARFSALLAAQASGRKVLVAYRSDSYDCNITNYSDSAYIVRTYSE